MLIGSPFLHITFKENKLKLMIPEKYLEYLALERILQKDLQKMNISTVAAMAARRNSLEKEIIAGYIVFEKEKE
jgi:hypothetical protein